MEITGLQYLHAEDVYMRIKYTLPQKLRNECPSFHDYICPTFYPSRDAMCLSEMGGKRYRTLFSPHARALLYMHVLQKLSSMKAQQ